MYVVLDAFLARALPRFASLDALYRRHILLTAQIQGCELHRRRHIELLMECLVERAGIEKELKRRGERRFS